jgi:hypothetical protein
MYVKTGACTIDYYIEEKLILHSGLIAPGGKAAIIKITNP